MQLLKFNRLSKQIIGYLRDTHRILSKKKCLKYVYNCKKNEIVQFLLFKKNNETH